MARAQVAAEPVPAAEAPIREADAAFVRDYNRGDTKALAAMFTEDAEVVEAGGDRYRGRDLIEKSFPGGDVRRRQASQDRHGDQRRSGS